MAATATTIKVGLRESGLEYARATLAAVPNGANLAIRSAINDTLNGEKTDLARRLREQIAVPYAEVRDRVKITDRPKAFSLSGTLSVNHRQIPLVDFKHTFREKSGGGVRATTLKAEGAHVFKHMFKTLVGSHVGVFGAEGDSRNTPKVAPSKGRYAGRILKRGPRKGQPLLRRPIQEAFGVSVMRVLEVRRGLLDEVTADTADKFHKRLLSKVDWQLGRATPALPA